MARSSLKYQPAVSTYQTSKRSMVVAFVASALIHLFVWLAVVAATDHAPRHRIGAPVMSVSLVSLPGPPSAPAVPPKTSEATAAVEPQKAIPKSVDAVPIKTKKKLKIKKSLKKKTLKPKKIVKNRLEKIEKQVADSRPPALEEKFQQLQRQVKEAEQSNQTPSPRSTADQSNQPSSTGFYGLANVGDPAVRDRLRIYQAEIAYHVQRNWVFSEQLARSDRDLVAELGITILPNGEIKDAWFDKKSGNEHLDDSAYKAIMKSNPLPPLPTGLFSDAYTVGLRFGPKGLKK